MDEQKLLTPKRHMSQKTKNVISNTAIYIVLGIMSIIWLVPFVAIVLQSFRMETTWMEGYVVPHKFGFGNYVKLFKETNFPKWFLNTFIMGLVVSVGQTIMV
ncbi:MAG: sugar ABC transporter permease, partial [Gammaproteobacteria bacterium]|nr:sugar ABC transporter permease [Gammaproteobacteria bacterium]